MQSLNKQASRKRYSERQFDKWVKWSINNRGKVLFKEIVQKQIQYNLVNDER